MNGEYPISVNCKKAEQLVVVTTWLGQMIHVFSAKATLQSFSDPIAPRVCPPALLDGQAAIFFTNPQDFHLDR